MTVTPIDLFASFIQLDQGGQAQARQPVFDREGSAWQMMTFHAETDADVHGDHWEVHPDAEEVVACLTGGIRLYFRPERPAAPEPAGAAGAGQPAGAAVEAVGEAAEEEVRLPAGSAVIVPRGRWHRIALDGPSDIMSVTVPRGSRLEQRSHA